jgi:hypothetical protein
LIQPVLCSESRCLVDEVKNTGDSVSFNLKASCFIGAVGVKLALAFIRITPHTSQDVPPEQPEDDPLWVKLFTEINARDNVVVLMALYSFVSESRVGGTMKY